MLQRIFTYCAWLGVLILAAYLRLHDLDSRPLHADEATGARILSNRLETQTYQFDPQHFHGPLLSLSTLPIAHAQDETSWQSLSKTTLRLGPAWAGILLVLTPLLWRRQIGSLGALAAAAFIATSPLLVYYNRMYIHESLLVLLTMITLPAAYRLVIQPSRVTAVIAGVGMGLMFATKETFAISIMAWLAATGAYYLAHRFKWHTPSKEPFPVQRYLLPAAILALVATLTASYFYSNGFRSVQGIVDAIKTYFIYETTAGHEKPFDYYFQLLVWPKDAIGMWWSEALILFLCLIAVCKILRPTTTRGVTLYLGIATIGHCLIYSFIGYKTPWLMLVPWAHACLLAGIAAQSLIHAKIGLRVVCALLLFAGLIYQTNQSLNANGRYASDARNPYAYVPTSKDTEALENWLSDLIKQQGAESLNPVAVIGSEYWPLPWYLRQFEVIGYWPKFDVAVESYPLVFATAQENTATAALLTDSHTTLPRSLRAEVPIILYLRNDIWEQWTTTTHD
jgi:uncharacterized protein (TIGR03663 family)